MLPPSTLSNIRNNELNIFWAKGHRCDHASLLQEGEQLMVEFLQKCKELKTEGSSEAELQEKVLKLKEEIQAHNNAYITALLAQT
jgi:hypothetical protein